MTTDSHFRTTRWSVVTASRGTDPAARAALDELCTAYWYPLYAFLRRGGRGDEESLELVQEFLAGLLEGGSLAGVDPEVGRFRSYLVGALQHHVANERRSERAEKRGGGRVASLQLDAAREVAAQRYRPGAGAERTPREEFERSWALEIVDRATGALREEHESRGRAAVFEALRDTLDGSDGGRTHAERAQVLDCSIGAVKVAAHRMRQRLRELIRDEVSQTVAGREDVDEELRVLGASLGSQIAESP
ncbi:MAG: sigma-70 family RNA polymerase sigma factor [Planctomycetota bacterium]